MQRSILRKMEEGRSSSNCMGVRYPLNIWESRQWICEISRQKHKILDIGHGLFTIRFQTKDDKDKVLQDGPWFVNNKFLTRRRWEPNFKTSLNSFSAVAVWVWILELGSEFYSEHVLKVIGESIGSVLKIDSYKFPRICVHRKTWIGNVRPIFISYVRCP